LLQAVRGHIWVLNKKPELEGEVGK